jgi:uncharacterized protein
MYLTKRLIEHRLPDGSCLVLNTLSGAVDVIEAETWETLRSGDPRRLDALPPSLLKRLRDRSYIFASPAGEKRCLDRVRGLAARQAEFAPTQYVFNLTYKCNMACVYCFEGDLTDGDLTMSVDDVRAALRAVDTLASRMGPNYTFVLFGGEPLLPANLDLVRLVLDRARAADVKVQIVTNGYYLGDYVAELRSYADAIDQIQVTIDGPEEVHDRRRPLKGGGPTFKAVTEGVERALAGRLRVSVRANVDRDNIEDFPRLVDWVEEKGWLPLSDFSCYAYPVTYHRREASPAAMTEGDLLAYLQRTFRGQSSLLQVLGARGFKSLAHIANVIDPESVSVECPPLDRYCEAVANGHWSFAPDGLIYPCSQSLGVTEMAVGRYRPSLVVDETKIRHWKKRNVFEMTQCQECAYALICGGGCAFEAWSAHGDIGRNACGTTRAVVHAYLDSMTGYILNAPDRGEVG